MKRDKFWKRKTPQFNWWKRGVKQADLDALARAQAKRERIARRNLGIKEPENERGSEERG